MSELLFDMEADQATASSIEQMDNTGLSSVAEIARAVRNHEDLVNKLEDQLKAAKRELLKLTDEDLPAMLQELGLNSFELEDGSKVTVRPTFGAHIKAENRETAFGWLVLTGSMTSSRTRLAVTLAVARTKKPQSLSTMRRASVTRRSKRPKSILVL